MRTIRMGWRAPGIRTVFVVRNRYAEDELTEAVSRGVGQYVILGAGLDSFSYRRPDLMNRLQVFELDRPASQAWKRARLAQLGMSAPSGLHYVPIDFERQTLSEALTAAGLDVNRRAFYSWLGVTQYLSSDAVIGTLGDVAGLTAPGGQLVTEFVARPETLSPEGAALVRGLAANTARQGEPWLSLFDPREIEGILLQAGFSVVSHFGPAEATRRYLEGRSDDSRISEYFRMVEATV